ncbi:MAG: hypothetical protein JNJ59_27650 [Deltaproteobacteria bacterium]|nr:hypothetical protein [Deltaproteobacteria bacterium]
MRTQAELHALTREVLGADYVELQVARYTLTEDLASGRASIATQLTLTGSSAARAIEGEGVGLVDALFKGIQRALVADYPSIANLFFDDFHVAGDFRGAKKDGARTDVPGTVRLGVENASGRSFSFEHTSPSVSASSVQAVLRAVEHFVNAELAVLKVYSWIEDARRRSRPDLADKYTQRLADLVQNASSSETIERTKKALG